MRFVRFMEYEWFFLNKYVSTNARTFFKNN
jgi:hypothetical protein